MNLSDCYLEEDLFPKIFTDYEERDYGILFYNEDNSRICQCFSGIVRRTTPDNFFISANALSILQNDPERANASFVFSINLLLKC